MSIEEYYYRLEDALETRSIVSETYEDLVEFKLKEELEKPCSIDPFVDALCQKYGIYCKINIEGFFQTLMTIMEGASVSSNWSDLNIKKFVYNQLSDYYLKCEYNSKLHNHYFELAVINGHRVAIQEKAELLFSGEKKNIPHVIELCKTAIELGNTDCYRLLIECYTMNRDFDNIIDIYAKLIDLGGDIQSVKDFHLFINTNCDEEKYIQRYLEILIKSSNKFTINYILLYKAYINENLIVDLLLESDKNYTALLPKLLCIFNQDTELFVNFIDLVCQRLKSI